MGVVRQMPAHSVGDCSQRYVSMTEENGSTRGLNTRQVATIVFAMTCAGPFGLENLVGTMGPTWTLLGLLAILVLFVVPSILITCELSLLRPLSNGGAATWVYRAFGRTASSVAAINMLVYLLVDLATYPTLFATYIDDDLRAGLQVPEWGAAVFVLLLGLAVNLRGIGFATEVFLVILVVVLVPFVIGVGLAVPDWRIVIPQLTGSQRATTTPPTYDLNLFVSTLIWLNSGYDSMGNLAVEVRAPRDMFRGMCFGAVAGFLTYVLSMLAALPASPGSWEDGYLAKALGRLWSPLEPSIQFGATLATTLLYMSELTTVAHLVASMGDPEEDLRLLPRFFSRKLRSGVPVAALLTISALQFGLVQLEFDFLVQCSTLLHTFAYVQVLAAYACLVIRRDPDEQRDFEVPGGLCGGMCLVFMRAPLLLFLLASACTAPGVVAACVALNLFAMCLRWLGLLRASCGRSTGAAALLLP